jgi:hypothetical protein
VFELVQPKDSQVVLSMPVPRLLCRDQHTAIFRQRAYTAGFRTVRDLISTPASEIFKLVPTSKGNQDRIRRALQIYGLDLR